MGSPGSSACRVLLQCRRPQFNSWVQKICWRKDRLPTPVFLGFPGGSAGKESTCNAGDPGLIPELSRYPGEGNGYPLPYSGLENSMYSPWGYKESDATERLSFHFTSGKKMTAWIWGQKWDHTVAKGWKQPVSVDRWADKESWSVYLISNGTRFHLKKEEIPTCYNVGKSWGHDAEWNKPKVESWLWGGKEQRMNVSWGQSLSFARWSALEVGGEVCTTGWMHLTSLNCTVKNG